VRKTEEAAATGKPLPTVRSVRAARGAFAVSRAALEAAAGAGVRRLQTLQVNRSGAEPPVAVAGPGTRKENMAAAAA
jgi:hypothetical protein